MIDIFADTADLSEITRLNPEVRGFTTNATLMRKAGVTDYESWAKTVLEVAAPKPVSLPVLSESPTEIQRQASKLDSWGPNVWIKVPVISTSGVFLHPEIIELAKKGLKVNVTAIMAEQQLVEIVLELMKLPSAFMCFSVFAGRIDDAGWGSSLTLRKIVSMLEQFPAVKTLYASVRSMGDVDRAISAGCSIITIPPSVLAKRWMRNADRDEISRVTVEQFANDAREAGYQL